MGTRSDSMFRRSFLLTLALLFFAAGSDVARSENESKRTVKAAATPIGVSRLAPLLLNAATTETEKSETRAKIFALSRKEALELIFLASSEKESARQARAYDVIRRRDDFDASMAITMLREMEKNETMRKSLRAAANGPDLASRTLEKRVALFVRARSGQFKPSDLVEELKLADMKQVPSATRLAILNALADASHSVGIEPSVPQLTALLGNDIFEIRVFAVDWFSLASRSFKADARTRFLEMALATDPAQVREHAYRAMLEWPKSEIEAVVIASAASGAKILGACEKEHEVARSACNEAKTKFAAKGTK